MSPRSWRGRWRARSRCIIDLYDRSDKTPAGARRDRGRSPTSGSTRPHHRARRELPTPVSPPLFSLVDIEAHPLSRQRDIGRPFWIDSGGQSGYVDIRVEVEKGTIFRMLDGRRPRLCGEHQCAAPVDGRFLAGAARHRGRRSCASRSSRSSISPRRRAASAWATMSAISRRAAPREVREAAQAFLNMKERIERHVEQRTAMLAGVSA